MFHRDKLIVARTVVRANDALLERSPAATVSLTPLLGRRTRGLMVAVAL